MVPEGTVDDRSPTMTLPRTVAEILRDHVTLEGEGITLDVMDPADEIRSSSSDARWRAQGRAADPSRRLLCGERWPDPEAAKSWR